MTRTNRGPSVGKAVERRGTISRRGLVGGAAVLAGSTGLPGSLAATGQERGADREEALGLLLRLERASLAFYRAGLERWNRDALAAAGLPADAFPALGTIRDQEAAHVAALAAFVGERSEVAEEPGAPDLERDAVTFVATAALLKGSALAAYARAAPAIGSGRALRTVLGIHCVEARHAATLNVLAGRPPFPDAIDAPLGPDEAPATVERARRPASTPDAGTPAAGLDDPRFAEVAADAAARLGVPQEELQAVRVEAREWPDASLGCPEPDMLYAQVLTPGFLVVVAGGGRELEYHTDEGGTFVSC